MANNITKYPTANCTMNKKLRTSCCHQRNGPTRPARFLPDRPAVALDAFIALPLPLLALLPASAVVIAAIEGEAAMALVRRK